MTTGLWILLVRRLGTCTRSYIQQSSRVLDVLIKFFMIHLNF